MTEAEATIFGHRRDAPHPIAGFCPGRMRARRHRGVDGFTDGGQARTTETITRAVRRLALKRKVLRPFSKFCYRISTEEHMDILLIIIILILLFGGGFGYSRWGYRGGIGIGGIILIVLIVYLLVGRGRF
jgi:hypothetical protein